MHIKFLVMDVDGTLTDGKIYMMGSNGEAMKAFNIKDGCGLSQILPKHNIIPIIITARESKILEKRCQELHITELHQDSKDKLSTLTSVLKNYNADLSSVAYIGDDLADLDVMNAVKNSGGTVLCPADAIEKIKNIADYISPIKAGDGAVRDCIDNYLLNRDGDNMQNTPSETPFPSASLLLDCVKDEYSKERERTQSLDSKASFFMSSILAVVTLFIPVIPFDKFYVAFIKGSTYQIGSLCALVILLGFAFILLGFAFWKLYTVYRLKPFKRFEIENATDLEILKMPYSVIEKELCIEYAKTIEENIAINTNKAENISLGLHLSLIGFLSLSIFSIILVICLGNL